MAVTYIDNLPKVKLDSEFSLINSMSEKQLRDLADEYEMLKATMTRQIVDIADKLHFIYARIQNPGNL